MVLVLALAKFAKGFERKRLEFYCDNQVRVFAINLGSSRDIVIQRCLRHLHKLMAWYSIDVKVVFSA